MKFGYVAIIGRPNVGKSSLLNEMLDFDLAITTATPQTTRDQIKGIFNDEESQIVFMDTPGIHKPQQRLGESLNKASYDSIKEADIILFLSPYDQPIGKGDLKIIEKLDLSKTIAIMTKIDIADEQQQLNEKAAELKETGFLDIVGTSIDIKESVDGLVKILKDKLPEGIKLYGDEVTDRSSRFFAKEIIRKSAIIATKEEVPHSIGIVVEEYKEVEDGPIEITAIIYVARDSQKGILIGKQGSMIKKIGVRARRELKVLLDSPIRLNLFVKVKKKWNEIPEQIKNMGY